MDLSDQVSLQDDLNSIYKWSRNWKMKFKEEKCVHIKFTKSSKPLDTSYTLNSSPIAIQSRHTICHGMNTTTRLLQEHTKYWDFCAEILIVLAQFLQQKGCTFL